MTDIEQPITESANSEPSVVLADANVLWGRFTRQALLKLDESGVCEIWRTEEILSEMERNLREDQQDKPAENRLNETQISRIITELRANPGRMRPSARDTSIEAIGRDYTSDEGDRHLLATCVEHNIPTLITQDKGFDAEACTQGLGVEIVNADEFLKTVWNGNPEDAQRAIGALLGEFAGQYDLARSLFEGCPRFEALVRAHFGLPPLE